MRLRIWLVAALAAAGSAIVGGRAQDRAERASLDLLLNRAAWYLDYFIDQFENVVAEERYIQQSTQPLPNIFLGGRGAVVAQPSPSDISRSRHRELRSDYLLVKSPISEALVPFRDVLEVDGVAVRDRDERLARLFVNPTQDAMSRAEQIGEDGARYNLGAMRSTLGNPMLALGALQASYQPRFRFILGKEDRSVGPAAWTVEYKEDAPPSMIRGEAGGDLFSHGRVWIDLATGRVLKTELLVEQPTVSARVTTWFRFDERFQVAVPSEMREQYTLSSGNRVTTIATYGRFRRFGVTAEEEFRAPLGTTTDAVSGMTFVEIPAGRFTMGSAASETGRGEDETLHDVEITRPFLLGRFEVTQEQWTAVMGTNPSRFAGCPRCPVETVTYDDVQRFLDALNRNASATLHYRLPTEAEWEYACRANTTGPFATGENLTTAQANYNGRFPYASFAPGEYRQRTTPAGTFPLNPWGLGDMHGNVWEWTSDWYGAYPDRESANIDPHGAAAGEKRVIRGGSWYFDANSARCALRYTHAPQDMGFSLGFRVAADRGRRRTAADR